MTRILAALAVIVVVPHASAESVADYAPPGWLARSLPESSPVVEVPSYFDAVEEAAQLVHQGQYRRARMRLHDADVPAEDRAAADRVVAEAAARMGDVGEALERIAGDDSIEAALLRARIHLLDRQPREAVAVLRPVVAAEPENVVARTTLGQALEAAGEHAEALAVYSWYADDDLGGFTRWQSADVEAAPELTAIATGLDRWATMTTAYAQQPSLHDDVLALHVRSYDVADRAWWPGRVATAAFLLQRGNREEAAAELEAAAAMNPRGHDLLTLVGNLHVSGFNFAEAEAVVREFRTVDPDSFDAGLLQARNLLKMRQAADALPIIDGLLKRRPDDLETLGLRAGALAVLLRHDESTATIARVEELDPDNFTAYHELGVQLDNLRQYDRGEAAWRKTIERAPWFTAARNGLGLLLTQSGKEDAARVELAAAFDLDPFNVGTKNYLNLLDEMLEFEQFETEHFIIEYHPDYDAALVPFVAEYLESVHPEQVERFGFEPAVKTRIQFFPRHDQFSVRIAGDPFVGTVGACTGPVIAMVSPADPTLGNYPWAEVLRHEYAHTITLGATENRIPHWMTEGLAVTEEPGPIMWRRVPLLAGAVLGEELFPIDRLTWGFIRPQKPTDRSLAYAQSGWVSQYITERWGDEATRALLDAALAGKTEAAAFEETLGMSLPEFFDAFEPWARQQVAPWGYDAATTEEYNRLLPEAEALVKGRQWEEAVELWEALRRLRPDDPLPLRRLAGLYLRPEIGRRAEGIDALRQIHDREEEDSRYAKLAANLLWQDGQKDEAIRLMRGAILVDVYDEAAHAALAEWLDGEEAQRHARALEQIKAMRELRASTRL